MTNIYSAWMRILNNYEMHKTETSWEYHYTQKIFVANFLVAYLSLVNVWFEELVDGPRLTSILVFHCMDLYPFWRSRVTLLDRVECQPQPSKGRLSETTWATGVLCCHRPTYRLCYRDDPSIRYEASDA